MQETLVRFLVSIRSEPFSFGRVSAMFGILWLGPIVGLVLGLATGSISLGFAVAFLWLALLGLALLVVAVLAVVWHVDRQANEILTGQGTLPPREDPQRRTQMRHLLVAFIAFNTIMLIQSIWIGLDLVAALIVILLVAAVGTWFYLRRPPRPI